jgi:hypothetical protein
MLKPDISAKVTKFINVSEEAEWKAMKFKPYEYRTLWNPYSSNPQGQLKLWVDILTPEEAQRIPPEDISRILLKLFMLTLNSTCSFRLRIESNRL